MAPDRETSEKAAARYAALSRLGCLGVLAAGLVIAAGVGCLMVGVSSSDAMLQTLGAITLGVGLLGGAVASATNLAFFGLSIAKRMEARSRYSP
ncbi:MAG: hypothetical protein IT377_03715 [Polyangiaceae bacterium]|nr:hypothetical protein [Myxococcales bacterium]MCC6898054.1 hypothetical protein [Polyangiaceae bacterium]